jgi:uncharacterized UBP type Zn finger protein
MAYYCEDCQRKVGSDASASVHRRFGHAVALLETMSKTVFRCRSCGQVKPDSLRGSDSAHDLCRECEGESAGLENSGSPVHLRTQFYEDLPFVKKNSG